MTQKDYIQLLKEEWAAFAKSIATLKRSHDQCSDIELENELTFEEEVFFDSLTSKFARSSDMFSQKILKLIIVLLDEEAQFAIDRANLAEKMYLVDSAEELLEQRRLRNRIAHEYAHDIKQIYEEVRKSTPSLLKIAEGAEAFLRKRELLA